MHRDDAAFGATTRDDMATGLANPFESEPL